MTARPHRNILRVLESVFERVISNSMSVTQSWYLNGFFKRYLQLWATECSKVREGQIIKHAHAIQERLETCVGGKRELYEELISSEVANFCS